VVYDIPGLWNDGETKSPDMIKVRENQLTWITFLSGDGDTPYSFDEDKVEKRNNDSYFFRIESPFLFQWVDKKKHIAKWTTYYSAHSGEDDLRIMSSSLYIDSLYNTFPIVDYEWKEGTENAICDPSTVRNGKNRPKAAFPGTAN
jgi:hypothetical protein